MKPRLYSFKSALACIMGDEARASYSRLDDGRYTIGFRCYDDYYPIAIVDSKRDVNEFLPQYNRILEEDKRMTTNKSKFYTLDELLPSIDATARAYAETVADTYVIGIEHKGELFPLQTVDNALEADAIVIDLQRALDEHFGVEPAIAFDKDEADMLEGFTFVPNKGMASIRIYTNNRLQMKGDLKTLLGIKPQQRVLIAFNPSEQAFAIVKPSAVAVTNDMRAAGYFVSKRKDVTCAKLFREFHLDKYEGTTFYADTASLSGNVVIFKR